MRIIHNRNTQPVLETTDNGDIAVVFGGTVVGILESFPVQIA